MHPDRIDGVVGVTEGERAVFEFFLEHEHDPGLPCLDFGRSPCRSGGWPVGPQAGIPGGTAAGTLRTFGDVLRALPLFCLTRHCARCYQPRLPQSYTKLGHGGVALPDDAVHEDDGGPWIMTRDNVTGLTWELKTQEDGLRRRGNTYTWYDPDPDTNGGDAGTQDGGECTGSHCDTHSFVEALNEALFGGGTGGSPPGKNWLRWSTGMIMDR